MQVYSCYVNSCEPKVSIYQNKTKKDSFII